MKFQLPGSGEFRGCCRNLICTPNRSHRYIRQPIQILQPALPTIIYVSPARPGHSFRTANHLKSFTACRSHSPIDRTTDNTTYYHESRRFPSPSQSQSSPSDHSLAMADSFQIHAKLSMDTRKCLSLESSWRWSSSSSPSALETTTMANRLIAVRPGSFSSSTNERMKRKCYCGITRRTHRGFSVIHWPGRVLHLYSSEGDR